ncbi:uncharacterized protein LOC127709502 isoform X2 [Mytilus californianus]|uniref:uncharacterized protein LOC127709502 isoform X2 n=1 Tax=Mytilus californianus TaxID=6549 RepID=UPI002246B600|nr:uncharacterized protein LOC127709502 isoform X2 [Mytilus californianus]XP_052071066.1 uncharacterized protein LOC127709502 isoform X2 [Mytilus californianus]XP_052071067.1 uncharacterized protein LOC127709502 isoform X2 [Mytilus californianus]
MIRSIAMHNFVHFHEEQRLVFEEGANFVIGGNSTGKTALFELIRRCYSNKINTTTSSVLNKNELAYALCHFMIPEHYPSIEKLELFPSKEEQPKEILACIFIKSQGSQSENRANAQANEYECYKVICSISGKGFIQTFVQKFIGSYGCYTKQLDNNTKGCKRISLDKSVIEEVKLVGTKTIIHDFYKIITNDFETTATSSSDEVVTSMNGLYAWLEKGYVGILPMRSIGPLQWTKSELNQHESRDENYENADRRAEILLNLLDNELVDKKQEKVFHDQIVHPYEFMKLNGKIEVRNTERKDLSPKRLLKTPEGILEAKQLTLILSHKEFSTVTIEEPDRGMHPHMIKKMRDLILRRITGKTVLIITHNPSLIDKWAMSRTFVSSKSILNETICHSICKVPQGYDKLCKTEQIHEMTNLLFSSRILFVEGKTDKIVEEAIFCLLIHDDKISGDKRISMKQKHFLLATDIRESSGSGNGRKKKEFCKKMKKEIYILFDNDVKGGTCLANEDEDESKGECTFYWKNCDLEQRFIDILDNCQERSVINAVIKIIRIDLQEGDEKYNIIDNYLQYRKQIKDLEEKSSAITCKSLGEKCNTSSSVEIKKINKDKNEVQKKIKHSKDVIKNRLKKKIPDADSEDIEIIANEMIHKSKEVEEFIAFL